MRYIRALTKRQRRQLSVSAFRACGICLRRAAWPPRKTTKQSAKVPGGGPDHAEAVGHDSLDGVACHSGAQVAQVDVVSCPAKETCDK